MCCFLNFWNFLFLLSGTTNLSRDSATFHALLGISQCLSLSGKCDKITILLCHSGCCQCGRNDGRNKALLASRQDLLFLLQIISEIIGANPPECLRFPPLWDEMGYGTNFHPARVHLVIEHHLVNIEDSRGI